jgi:hypothetical protein
MKHHAHRIVTAVVLGGALVLGSAVLALAGQQHARSTVFGGLCESYGAENGVAECTASLGRRWNQSHEQNGLNWIHGNSGSGHAHHHGSHTPIMQRTPNPEGGAGHPLPVLGSAGSSEYVLQTWAADATGTNMIVTWSPKSFLQVDLSELSGTQRSVASRASLTANTGLSGSVELSATLGARKTAQTSTRLTGAFKGVPFDLVKHPGGVVSLQFRGPVSWTVRATPAAFDIALDGSVDSPLPPKGRLDASGT